KQKRRFITVGFSIGMPPLAGLVPRSNHAEAKHHQEKEQPVNDSKGALAHVEKKNAPHPVLYERTAILPSATSPAQLVLPRRQWTNETQERLPKHKPHRQQMRHSKTPIAHKSPPQKISKPNDDEPGHDKRDEGKMHHQDQISEDCVYVHHQHSIFNIPCGAIRLLARNHQSTPSIGWN